VVDQGIPGGCVLIENRVADVQDLLSSTRDTPSNKGSSRNFSLAPRDGRQGQPSMRVHPPRLPPTWHDRADYGWVGAHTNRSKMKRKKFM